MAESTIPRSAQLSSDSSQTNHATECSRAESSHFQQLPDDERKLWLAYWEARDTDSEAALYAHYADLADRMVRYRRRRYMGLLDADELFSAVSLGLLNAIRGFNPELSTFRKYAASRMMFAIRDELRARERYGRGMGEKVRAMNRAKEDLAQEGVFQPPVALLAERMGITHQEAGIVARASQHAVSLNAIGQDNGAHDSQSAFDIADPSPDADPAERLEMSDLKNHLLNALEDRQRRILAMWIDESMTQKEIAESMNLCPGRISQIIRGVLGFLRRYISERML